MNETKNTTTERETEAMKTELADTEYSRVVPISPADALANAAERIALYVTDNGAGVIDLRIPKTLWTTFTAALEKYNKTR